MTISDAREYPMWTKRNDELRLAAAARYYYERTGERVPTTVTVRVWMKQGRYGVRLKAYPWWVTTKEWMDEFIQRSVRK
jgi:hypothetical protein